MRDNYPGQVPDFTRACVVMFGVNVTWILVAIWTIWGLLVAMLFGWLLNKGIEWLDRYRLARRAAAIKRGKS